VKGKTATSGFLSPQYGASSGRGWRKGLSIWRVAANIFNKQSRTADKGWSSSMRVGRGANNSPQTLTCYETLYKASNWRLEQRKKWLRVF